MNAQKIAKYGQRLQSTIPFFGRMRRRAACRKLAADSSPKAVPYLLSVLGSNDPVISATANQALSNLRDPSSIDTLCELAIADPAGSAMAIVKKNDYHHQSFSRRCVLFLLAGEIERYLELDFEFQHLRAEYQAATGDLKNRIGEVVRRSGDTRLLGLFQEVRRRKLARDLTPQEAGILLEVHANNHQWEEIFNLLFHIPLRSVVAALDVLSASGWRPESQVEVALLNELLDIRKNLRALPPEPPPPEVALGKILQKWIEEGRSSTWTGKSEDDLWKTFRWGPPTEAVMALAALALLRKTTYIEVEQARTHPHWLVRLACLSLCELTPQLAFSDQPIGGEGGGMWIDRLSPALLDAAAYHRRAESLNPDQLEGLQTTLSQPQLPSDQRRSCGRLLEALARHHLRHTILLGKELTVEISKTAIEIE